MPSGGMAHREGGRLRPMRALALAMGVLALPFAASAEPGGLAISVSAPVQSRLGLQTKALTGQKRASHIDGFAKVLDPGPLAQLESDLLAAEASAEASKAEAARARALNAAGGSVASKDAEAAIAQAGNDAARLDLLRRRLGLEWGPGVARMKPAQRSALIQALSRGDAALVHVDTHNNEGQDGVRTVEIDVGSTSVHGVVLGPARAAEPRLQSSGLIAEVKGKSAVLLSVGLIQGAHLNTASNVAGVLIPRTAVIRFEGSDWAYVKTGAEAFERRRLDSPAPEADGLFVAGGFAPGDQVVVQGAAELFGVEQVQATRSR